MKGHSHDTWYRLSCAVPVKTATLRFLKNVARRSTVHVGIDIGKNKLYVVVRWSAPRAKHAIYEQPWFVVNPNEIPELIKKLQKIAKRNTTIIGIFDNRTSR